MPPLKDLLKKIDRLNAELQALLPMKPEFQHQLDKKIRLEINYNSNHLEGNTLTYNETELLLLFDQTTGDHEMREYEEMKAHDVALKMIQQEAEDKERPLTEHFIRQLNEWLLVRPFYKEAVTPDGQATRKRIEPGMYKSTPNSVRLANGEMFHYASPEETPAKMTELVENFLASESSENPVILAALLHYNFVRIHPFDDGNGWVARLLMNYVLLRNNLPLVIIRSDDKKNYLSALNKADAGNLEAFTAYVAEQVSTSLTLYLKAASGETLVEEDDWEKELELLKREINVGDDFFNEKKSQKIIAQTIDENIMGFILSLGSTIRQKAVHSLFVEIGVKFNLLITNSSGVKTTRSYHISFLDETAVSPFSKVNFNEIVVHELGIVIEFDGIKKVQELKKFDIILSIVFEEYQYTLSSQESQQSFRLPYGKKLSSKNLDSLVKNHMRAIVTKMKEVTAT